MRPKREAQGYLTPRQAAERIGIKSAHPARVFMRLARNREKARKAAILTLVSCGQHRQRWGITWANLRRYFGDFIPRAEAIEVELRSLFREHGRRQQELDDRVDALEGAVADIVSGIREMSRNMPR